MFPKMSTSIYCWVPRWQPFLFAEGDAGAAGGSGDAGNAGGGDAAAASGAVNVTTAPALNLAEFAASLDKLNDNLGGKLDAVVGTVREAAAREPPAAEAPPVDLESLSRAELVAHISSSITEAVQQMLQEHLTPVREQLSQVQTNAATREATAEVATLRAANKDFADWKDDMIALAKQPMYASLAITDLYQLARAKNGAKVAELDKKYNPPAPKPPSRFGGLTGSTSGTGNGAKPLSPREAGIEAYREVQARHSDILPALESI